MDMRPDQETIDRMFEEAYQLMYEEAEPKLDFAKALKDGYCKKTDWFLRHWLPQKRQDEIAEEVAKRHLNKGQFKRYLDGFKKSLALGSSPTGNREVMRRERGLPFDKIKLMEMD